jgi:hypothetical protein
MLFTQFALKGASFRPFVIITSQSRWYRSHWDAYRDIDWGRAEGKLYVVLDPLDSNLLEYLTPTEYRSLRKQCISNDVTLEVIANPRSDPGTNPHRSPNGDDDGEVGNDHSNKSTGTKPGQVK